MELEKVAMKRNRRSNQRRRGLGGCLKALFRSILIHAGCLSPSDRDEILIPGRRDRRNTNNHGSSSYNLDNSSTRNINRNSGEDNKSLGGRHRNGQKDTFKDGIEEKQGNLGLNNKYSGAMFSLQNCTLHCDVCRNGETYWASFTERSFHKGHQFKLYRGIINGQGPQSREKCVVKVFARSPGTEERCRAEVRKSERMQQLTRPFNQRTKRQEDRIRCQQTFWAQVDEVSKLKQLFFTGKRKLRIGESVLFQPDIRIVDDKPGKLRKVSHFMDTQGKQVGHHVYPVLNAFVHYTYHITNGELVVCGFEGVVDEEGFSLITPVIHSKGHTYGDGDLGEAGIMNVFNNHVCNSLCHDLTVPYLSKPREFRQITFMEEAKEEEVDPGESSSMYHFPQDLADTRSHQLDRRICTSAVTASRASEFTESMGPYMEPSAPDFSECLRHELIMPPPAYTQQSAEQVSHWLIKEEACNSFMQMYTQAHGPVPHAVPHPTRPVPHAVPHPTRPVPHSVPHPTRPSLSVISQAALIASHRDNGVRRSSDVNANYYTSPAVFTRIPVSNFPADRCQFQRILATSETATNGDFMETFSTNSAVSSSYPASSRRMSEINSARSDVAMKTCSSSGSSPSLRTRNRQGSTCSGRGVDNAIFHDHNLSIFQTNDLNRSTRPTRFVQEQPPSYEQSEEFRRVCQVNVGCPDSSTDNNESTRTSFQDRIWY